MRLRRRFIVSIFGPANSKIEECMRKTLREIITNAPLILLPILFSIKMPAIFTWLTVILMVATLLVSGIIYFRVNHLGALFEEVTSVTIVDIVFWALGCVIWYYGKQSVCSVIWGAIAIVLVWIYFQGRCGKLE